MARKAKKTALTPEERLRAALVPEGEQPYPVQGNWCWTFLTTGFAECKDSFRKPINATERAGRSGIIPYYGATGQVGWIDNYLTDEQLVLLGEDGAPFLDILKDKAYLIEGKAWVNNHAHILCSHFGDIGNRYLAHYLNCFNFKGYVNGTTRLKLTQANMDRIPVPLPPLPEQQRIVARIESLFAKLDEAKEKVQAALDSFEPRKAAVLHRAFSGELTEGWRKEQVIGKETWIRVPLIDILREKPRNGYSPSPVSYQTETKSMTLSAVTSGVFMPEYYKYIDVDIPADSYLWLEPGDILIQRANSLDKVGSSALYTGGHHEFIYPDLMMKLRLKENIVNQFVAYQLKTDEVMTYIRANATGTAGNMPKINQKTVSHIPIVLPTIDEQTEIVRILDAFFEQESQAKAQAEAALEAIDTMKKSILAKAFRGELGTNDPEEESALALLKQSLDTDR